jgi:TetR/AcrR family transcriptional repressor of bet genes
MHALMALDLSPTILDRRMLAVWFAFWGEVKSRPRYRLVCEESDQYYDSVMRSLCDELIADGGYSNITSAAVATMLTSASNGMWLSYLISPKRFDRDSAANAVDEYLQSIFPKHFPLREDSL